VWILFSSLCFAIIVVYRYYIRTKQPDVQLKLMIYAKCTQVTPTGCGPLPMVLNFGLSIFAQVTAYTIGFAYALLLGISPDVFALWYNLIRYHKLPSYVTETTLSSSSKTSVKSEPDTQNPFASSSSIVKVDSAPNSQEYTTKDKEMEIFNDDKVIDENDSVYNE